MSKSPPLSYTTLKETLNIDHRNPINLIGVVESSDPPRKSSGTDNVVTIRIKDRSLYDSASVRIFRRRIEDLPNIDSGDGVIVKSLKKLDKGLISNFHTVILTFKRQEIDWSQHDDQILEKLTYDLTKNSAIKSGNTSNMSLPTKAEKLYILDLWRWMESSKGTPSTTTSMPSHGLNTSSGPPNQKQVLISDIKAVDKFYDLTVEVVRWYSSYDNVSLYVTDYTVNKQLFEYQEDNDPMHLNERDDGDNNNSKNNKWKGPLGKRAIQITLFHPHSSWALQHVKEGSILDLKNVRIANHRDKPNMIEGKMHGDRRYPDKITVSFTDESSPLYTSLIERKENYWQKSKSRVNLSSKARAKKKLMKESHDKNFEQSLQEQERLLREARLSAQTPFTLPITSGLNGQIVTRYDDKDFQSIHSILHSQHLHGKTKDDGNHITYPFINVMFRTRARVVDFYPEKIEDFSRNLLEGDYNDLGDEDQENSEMIDLDSTQPENAWEWAFWLELEDNVPNSRGERERMKVIVSGQDADYLLNLEACDLRRDQAKLAMLKEKLFILWGEVAEAKERGEWDEIKRPVNKPFNCCIAEYGVPNDEGSWTRLHRIKYTNIQ